MGTSIASYPNCNVCCQPGPTCNCSGTNIPTTLFATPSAGCSWFSGQVVTLTWDPVNRWWYGTFSSGANTLYLWINPSCATSGQGTVNDPNFADSGGSAGVVSSCVPYHMTFSLGGPAFCDTFGSFAVTVTQ